MGSDQKRAFIAIVLSGIVLFGWQAFFAPPRVETPIQNTKAVSATNSESASLTMAKAANSPSQGTSAQTAPIGATPNLELKNFVVENGGHSVTISNDLKIHGMQNPEAVFDFHKVTGDKAPFSIEYFNGHNYLPLTMVMEESRDANQLRGENAKLGIRLVSNLDAEGRFHFSLQSKDPQRYRYRYHMDEGESDNRQVRQLLIYAKEMDNFTIGSEDSGEASAKWVNIDFNKQKSDLTLGIVSRDYPHKNLKVLPDVAVALRQIYGINVRFLVTLTDDEWSMRDLRFYKYIDNVGSINIAQCPSFYKLLDGVIFPSLLECFSATPIESMIMKK
ncbi:MAG: hypothetical protein HN509_00765, partial [Halobacteriovoraceae bacterium]|nr:hypothetical protein [Halobacteriovoraceae bacterium]